MESQKRVGRNRAVILVALAALVFFTTACTCCWVPAMVQRAGSFGRAMPWRNRIGFSARQVEAREEISQRFAVSGPLSLQLHASVGDVRIEAGTGDQVEVSGTKYAYGASRTAAEARLREFRVDMRQPAPGSVAIEAGSGAAGEVRSPRVDLVIKVPRRSDVRAVVNVGELWVEGIEGSLDLSGNVGELTARDVVISGDNRLATNVGSVSVRLPADAAFVLDARSSVGSVSCEFPLQDERTSSTLVGRELRGRVGEAPEVTLTLRVNTGNVLVEQGR